MAVAAGFAALAMAGATGHAAEEEAAPGRKYAGGTRVRISTLGLSFAVPKGWVGALSPDGSSFLIGHETKPGLVVGRAEPGATMDGLKAQLGQPLPLDEATVLQPVGTPSMRGKNVTAEYTLRTPDGQQFVGVAEAMITGKGTAVAFVAMGPTASKGEYRTLVRGVIASVRTVAPPKGSSSGAWADALRGKALTFLKTSNGLSQKKHLSLCADGSFRFVGSETYLSSGGGSDFSAVGRDGDAGRWVIQGSTLSLTGNDGSVSTFGLAENGQRGELLVNGNRWFVTRDARCN